MTIKQRVQMIVSVLNNHDGSVPLDIWSSLGSEWGVSISDFYELVEAIQWAIKHSRR